MSKEKLTNVQRMQAIELLNKMKETYSELTFEIDAGTENILGNWEKAKLKILDERQKLLKEGTVKSASSDSETLASKMGMDVQGSGKFMGMGPNFSLIQFLTATKHQWNWHTENSELLRKNGLDARLINTVTGKDFDHERNKRQA